MERNRADNKVRGGGLVPLLHGMHGRQDELCRGPTPLPENGVDRFVVELGLVIPDEWGPV